MTRRILVTGAASGIGAGIVRHWAGLGDRVVATDIDDATGRVLGADTGATYEHLDVTDESAWRAFAEKHDTFDLVFLNAGISSTRFVFGNPDTSALTGFDLAAYRQATAVNVDGVVFGVAHLAPSMATAGRGDIVVTASMAGLYPIPPDPVYGLTKHAVLGYVKSLAPTLWGRGICLSAICPFFVDTPLVTKEQQAQIREVGFEVLHVDNVIEAAQVAVVERQAGAQWVVFPGMPVTRFPEPTLS
jgi:NAD(P)-dependent dehydrogenase (short-subunit alcohol dehydrogenase family)